MDTRNAGGVPLRRAVPGTVHARDAVLRQPAAERQLLLSGAGPVVAHARYHALGRRAADGSAARDRGGHERRGAAFLLGADRLAARRRGRWHGHLVSVRPVPRSLGEGGPPSHERRPRARLVSTVRPLRAGCADVRVRHDQGDPDAVSSAFTRNAGHARGRPHVERPVVDRHRFLSRVRDLHWLRGSARRAPSSAAANHAARRADQSWRGGSDLRVEHDVRHRAQADLVPPDRAGARAPRTALATTAQRLRSRSDGTARPRSAARTNQAGAAPRGHRPTARRGVPRLDVHVHQRQLLADRRRRRSAVRIARGVERRADDNRRPGTTAGAERLRSPLAAGHLRHAATRHRPAHGRFAGAV